MSKAYQLYISSQLSTKSTRLQPPNASTNLLRAPTLTDTQHQLGEGTNLQILQAPTCRQRQKCLPQHLPTSLTCQTLQMNQITTIQMYLGLPNTLLISTSTLCSSYYVQLGQHTLLFICSDVLFIYSASNLCSLALFFCSLGSIFSVQQYFLLFL